MKAHLILMNNVKGLGSTLEATAQVVQPRICVGSFQDVLNPILCVLPNFRKSNSVTQVQEHS